MSVSRDLPKKLIDRLKPLGIELLLTGNVPWIYLRQVNGTTVKEKYLGNHGFTAFWYPTKIGDKIKFSDRRKVFEKVRELVEGDEFIPELTQDDEYDKIGC